MNVQIVSAKNFSLATCKWTYTTAWKWIHS